MFNKEKLEEILVANWTKFIDSSKLLAFVLINVQRYKNNLARIPSCDFNQKGISITVSHFNWTLDGFILWVDFNVPSGKETANGTMELLLSHNSEVQVMQTLGNIYCP